MARIRLSKIAAAPNAVFPSAEWHEHVQGEDMHPTKSIPIDYWVEGELLAEVRIGGPVYIARDIRNGHKVTGLFSSSLVRKIEGDLITTGNSIYKIEYLK